MSRYPVDRRSPLALVIPLVAIVLTLCVGAFMNRRGHPDETQRDFRQTESRRKPGAGVGLVQMQAGTGTPRQRDGSIAGQAQPKAAKVAWARFDFTGSSADLFAFRGSTTIDLNDENGKRWPFDMFWIDSSLYLTVRPGYESPPNVLTAHVDLSGMEFATQTICGLPKPKALPQLTASISWPGLVVEACKLEGDDELYHRIFVDAPLPAGHILTGKFLGTSYLRDPQTECALKGPDPGTYLQTTNYYWLYPQSLAKAFLQVVEYAPVHLHKQLRFSDTPTMQRFGSVWIVGHGKEVPFGENAGFWIGGIDSVPVRPKQHSRQSIVLQLESNGLIRHVRARLLRPTSALSIPFVIRSQTVPNVEMANSPENWTSGPLEFYIDIEADVYRPIRKTTVAVDVGHPRVAIKSTNAIGSYPVSRIPKEAIGQPTLVGGGLAP